MRALHQALAGWYRKNGRRLPWRETTEAWPILVSEVMLQQTPVSRVEPHWIAFLDKYPTPAHLAAAPLTDVLAAWQGLGYPRRAARLREAAATISRDGWPRTVAGLTRLPGIGPYTAAAVACFSFGEPVPAVDVNLRRVLSRLTGNDLRGHALADAAIRHLDADRPDAWNQAMMDIGATLCRPHAPRCDRCPLDTWCSDPTVELDIRRQPPYEGSVRQLRGRILRVLGEGPHTLPQLATACESAQGDTSQAATSLEEDGLIERRGPRWAVVA